VGHEITLLLLQERFVPQPYHGRVALIFGAKSRFNPYLYFRRPEFGWKKFYTGGLSLDIIPGKHGQFYREPNIQALADAVRRRIEEAAKEPAQGPSRTEDYFQRLPGAAYRAKLTAREHWTAEPREDVSIPVEVKNVSSETWRSSDRSGIALANRWLNMEGKVVDSVDGRAPLAGNLEPGSSVEMELTVKAPAKAGQWLLELDLVEEGVTWFKDRGSPVAQLRVDVQRSSGFWNRIWSKKKDLVRRGKEVS
jgi:hypothetical protein